MSNNIINNTSCNNTIIPIHSVHKLFLNSDYKISQLKDICRHYKLRVSCKNKNELVERIYKFLKLSDKVIMIQRFWRSKLLQIYNNLRGPAIIYRKLCVNETDFFTMDLLTDVPNEQFISYKDVDNMIYGFNILSLYNLILKNGIKSTNPYNRNSFPCNIRLIITRLLRLSVLFNEPIQTEIEKHEQLTPIKEMELRCVSIFQEIDSLGNYTDHLWFWNTLQRKNLLIQYLRELGDIWNYRAQLSDTIKRDICPPNGIPFGNINVALLQNESLKNIQQIALNVVESMIKTGINEPSKCLGANYVLCALTLINNSAAESLPWLYQSVVNYI